MIIRCWDHEGSQFRINVEPTDTFSVLPQKLATELPKSADLSSLKVSNKPGKGDHRSLQEVGDITFAQIGFNPGDIIYIAYQTLSDGANNHPETRPSTTTAIRLNGKPVDPAQLVSPASTVPLSHPAAKLIKHPWETVKQSALDDALDKKDGKIARPRDARMCRHGAKGMCDYCAPLEPFSPEYQKEKKIKHLSYHAHLRKINSSTNKSESGSSFIPPLTVPEYRVRADCPAGHAPWPEGICTKCQPSAITLQPQSFRMVDHVEFASPEIVNAFIDFWRKSSCQRIGFLYGRYREFEHVPLGIAATVEAIYEPPQINEKDGITLLDWPNEKEVDDIAKACGMERVGVIFTDLLHAGKDNDDVVCKRHIDSYFMASLEVVFAARYQAKYPHPCKWSETGQFGSNFVTCMITGDEEGHVVPTAYQASNSAVELVRADIIEPSADPSMMLVQSTEQDKMLGRIRYIPEIFHRRKNEYGAAVQENAKPAFPVEHLLTTLNTGYLTSTSAPLFLSSKFTIENRNAMGYSQDFQELAKLLKAQSGGLNLSLQDLQVLSDFHLLVYIAGLGYLHEDDIALLLRVATTRNQLAAQELFESPNWQTLIEILKHTGEKPPKRKASVLSSTTKWQGNGKGSYATTSSTSSVSSAPDLIFNNNALLRNQSTEHLTKKVKRFTLDEDL